MTRLGFGLWFGLLIVVLPVAGSALANSSPVIPAIAPQYIFEGDSLVLAISAYDPDGDQLELTCPARPFGALFESIPDGTGILRWQAGYVGPGSADGSPFMVTVRASDGETAVFRDVQVHVVNRNRAPVISADDIVETEAGGHLQLEIEATDPDLEVVNWQVSGLPVGASFDYDNPGHMEWNTSFADSGSFELEFVAIDPRGAADTAIVTARVMAAVVYSLTLDVDSAYPGDLSKYQVSLENLEAVSSFDLLINYDPSVLSAIGLSIEQTRSVDFEYFTYSYIADDVPGNLRISAVADLPGGSVVSPLPPGSGPIVEIEFKVAGNIAYQGYTVPIRFVFPGDLEGKDNTLTDASGTRIETGSISYTNGSIQILKIGDVKIGDINLNGLDFEISDAIYFSNFYMNPYQYPLNPLQMANSDINGDYMAATIADLVALINVIVNGNASAPRNASPHVPVAEFSYETTDISTHFTYEASVDVGGLLISIVTDEPIDPVTVHISEVDMSLAVGRVGDDTRLLVYSLDGHTLPSGRRTFLAIDGLTDLEISSVSMSSADGRLVDISVVRKESTLPEKVTLSQNYPNPFNPETRIDFTLPETAHTRLVVFNLLGREVNVLIDDVLPAGAHSSVWDGSDRSGQAVASGVYYYRLESEFESVSRKMVLLK